MEANDVKTGTLEWFNSARFYGFIKNGEGSTFVHGSQIPEPIEVGASYSYQLGQHEGRTCAINLKLLENGNENNTK